MNTFQQMDLPSQLLKALDKLQFSVPTPIQSEAIPVALQGRDVVGSAQTGTGKTLAFGLPLLSRLMAEPKGVALILVPTRELAQQVANALDKVSSCLSKEPENRSGPSYRAALVIGGEPFIKQLHQLKRQPRIVVATPGRLIDHMERGSFKPQFVNFLVLDEMDRMFDLGFGIQLEAIVSQLPSERQTLMFSATLPKQVLNLAQKYLKDPVRIAVGGESVPAANIQQEVIRVSETEKHPKLLVELDKREGSIIVFVRTRIGADRLAQQLYREKYSVAAIHGDLRQNKRDRVLRAFRAGKNRIMVATDVAARGLDIPHIQHVINYDLPDCPEDYVHRIGRTARAGASGSALCLVTPKDVRKWNAIHALTQPTKAKAIPEEKKKASRKPFWKASKRRRPYGKSKKNP